MLTTWKPTPAPSLRTVYSLAEQGRAGNVSSQPEEPSCSGYIRHILDDAGRADQHLGQAPLHLRESIANGRMRLIKFK